MKPKDEFVWFFLSNSTLNIGLINEWWWSAYLLWVAANGLQKFEFEQKIKQKNIMIFWLHFWDIQWNKFLKH